MKNSAAHLCVAEFTDAAPGGRRHRSGFSLIEMVVVVGLSGLLMAIAVSLIFGLREWDRLSRINSTRNEQLLRLAGVLRSDIRDGSKVRVSDEGPLLVVTASGAESRYELRPEGCLRSVAEPGQVPRPGDLFAIGPAGRWNVKQDLGGRRPLVEVTLEAAGNFGRPSQRRLLPFLVVAALDANTFTFAPPSN